MRNHIWGASLAAVLMFAGAPALAQTSPQQPSQPSLEDEVNRIGALFRVNVVLANLGPTGTLIEEARDEYGLSTADDALNFLRDSDLRARFPTYNGTEAVTGSLDFRGVTFIGSFAPNSRTLVISIPSIGEELSFTGATRDEAYLAFETYIEDLDEAEAVDLVKRLLAAFSRESPVDPLAGNPGSLQGALVSSALDLGAGDSDIEASVQGGRGVDEPGWMIGVSGATAEAGRFETQRFDARLQRSFRILEGGRARLKIDIPISYTDVEGARQAVVALGAGLEIPVIARRWSLEPRVAYGVVAAPEAGSLGHMLSTSLTSRVVFEQVGRGHIVIGNMIGHTQTLPVNFFEEDDAGIAADLNPEISNVVFRNGIAYQFPLNARFMGRSSSLRASFTHTNFTGDALFLEQYSDVALSFGVRGREDSVRNAYELIRLTGTYTFGDDYSSFGLQLGFRF